MLTYLTQQDIQSSLRGERLNELLDDDDELLTPEEIFGKAVTEAGGLVKDHLLRYQIDEEFAKEGDERKSSIVFHMKNICLYILYERVPGDDIPERIIKNYNDSIETLREISKAKLSIDLPIKEVDTDGDGIGDKKKTKFQWGGDKPRRI